MAGVLHAAHCMVRTASVFLQPHTRRPKRRPLARDGCVPGLVAQCGTGASLAKHDVLGSVLAAFPTPSAMMHAPLPLLQAMMDRVGMQEQRANALVRMSQGFLGHWHMPLELYGIGPFAQDSVLLLQRGAPRLHGLPSPQTTRAFVCTWHGRVATFASWTAALNSIARRAQTRGGCGRGCSRRRCGRGRGCAGCGATHARAGISHGLHLPRRHEEEHQALAPCCCSAAASADAAAAPAAACRVEEVGPGGRKRKAAPTRAATSPPPPKRTSTRASCAAAHKPAPAPQIGCKQR